MVNELLFLACVCVKHGNGDPLPPDLAQNFFVFKSGINIMFSKEIMNRWIDMLIQQNGL